MDVSSGLCGRCRKALRPTQMDIVLEASGMTSSEFASMSGVSLRSVVRAARGEVALRTARRLASVTGIPVGKWLA